MFEELTEIISNVENVTDVLEEGAKEYISDLSKLAKPYSKITISGYTHLIDTFSYKREKDEVVVCWGKYYGPMVERGTMRSSASPHMEPTFEQNKEKYYHKMIDKIL